MFGLSDFCLFDARVKYRRKYRRAAGGSCTNRGIIKHRVNTSLTLVSMRIKMVDVWKMESTIHECKIDKNMCTELLE